MFTSKKIFFANAEKTDPYVQFNQQPEYMVIMSTPSATFSVSAVSVPPGISLSYQWYRLPKSSGDGVILSGETASTLTVSGLTRSTNDGDSYRVRVTLGGESAKQFSSSAGKVYFAASGPGDTDIINDGLFACGLNSQQALGDGTSTNRSWLVKTVGGKFSMVSAGARHGFGIKSNGELWGWGNGEHRVGLGTWGGQVLSPQKVGSDSWLAVSAGGDHTIAIKSDGTLWGWGLSSTEDGRAPVSNSPSLIDGSSWSSISAGGGVGDGHSMAIKSNGTLWARGKNNYGQLGLGDNVNKNSLVQVGSSTWTKVAAGYYHTVAIKSDGTLWSWGANYTGQLGDGTTTNRNSPVLVDGGTWVDISAGNGHSLAIKSDGTLWGWGYRIGDGTQQNRSETPKKIDSGSWDKVEAGAFGSAAIKSDGTLWTWGDNDSGEASNGQLSGYSPLLYPMQSDSGNWANLSFSKGSSHFLASY